jgi:hypothetical protein
VNWGAPLAALRHSRHEAFDIVLLRHWDELFNHPAREMGAHDRRQRVIKSLRHHKVVQRHCHINRFYWSVLTHSQRSVSIESMGQRTSRRGAEGLYLLDVTMPWDEFAALAEMEAKRVPLAQEI